MNKIKYIFQLFVLVTFFGCADEELVKTRDIEVTAGFADTRTTFTEGEGVTHVNWEVGDEIGLFSNNQINLTYKAQSEGSLTNFSPTNVKLEAQEEETVYAYYPHHYNAALHNIPIPDIYYQEYEKNKSSMDFLYAFGKVKDNKLSLKFNHLYSFLKITIPEALIADRGINGGLMIRSSETIGTFCGLFDIETQKITHYSDDAINEIFYKIPSTVKDKEITCYIAIAPQSESAEISVYKFKDNIVGGERLITKKAPKGGFVSGNVYTLYLSENEDQAINKQEREALIAFYEAAGGDNWQNKTNWCSNAPLNEWYGVQVTDGHVTQIRFWDNGLKGDIGDIIRTLLPLSKLKNILLIENGTTNISGEFPEQIYELAELESLVLHNVLSGELSSKITQLKKLKDLELVGVKVTPDIFRAICTSLTNLETLFFSYSQIHGSIPEEIANLKKLKELSLPFSDVEGILPDAIWNLPLTDIYLAANPKLSGTLPPDIQNLKNLDKFNILGCNFLGSIPDEICNCIELRELNLQNNNFDGTIPPNIGNLQNLLALYLQNNNLTGSLPVSMSTMSNLGTFHALGNRLSGSVPEEVVAVWDKWSPLNNITPQQEGYELTYNIYASTDYSKDGEVQLLQKHTEGNGIPVIFMGDAFVDTDMVAGGTYDAVMNRAMEAYFSMQPMTSLRPLFDVYSIRCVSENRQIRGKTALGSYAACRDTGGDIETILKYASRILGEDLSDGLINIIMNMPGREQAICYYLEDNCTVSFSALNTSEPTGDYCLESTILHEAVGHGLGHLADEYGMYVDTVSDEEKKSVQSQQKEKGWMMNLDFTSDPEQVLWSKFIADERYRNEDIGIYEGGLANYSNGVFRPSYNSIMRFNTGIFNAPSREAIYKRAMKLAYGDSWTYDYETFVKWDMEHYPKVETRAAHFNYVEKPMENHRPPVIINQTSAEILKQK